MATRMNALLRRPAVMGVAVAAVLTGVSTAAARDAMDVFEPRAGSATDGTTGARAAEGQEVDVTGDIGFRDVTDAATATAETGVRVPVVASLPRGITGEPVYKVGGLVTVVATSPASAPGSDGSAVRIDAGPTVAAIWSQASGLPRLVVVRSPVPTVTSTDGNVDPRPDMVQSLRDLPDDIVAQLRTIAVGTGLPFPLPIGSLTTSMTDVNGVTATMVVTQDKTFAAVAWCSDGLITVVAGSLDGDELLTIATSLR